MRESFVALEKSGGRKPSGSGGGKYIILGAVLCALVAALLWLDVFSSGPKLLEKPSQDIFVVDKANLISENDKKQMLALGHDMSQRFGAQLVVVTVDTLDGADIREYTNQLFRSWGIGSKEKNNGVLLFIAKQDRKFRIEVGYGLEGRISDGYAGSVLDGMKPDFKKQNYSPAILAAYGKLAGKIYEEYGAAPPQALAKLQPQQTGQSAAAKTPAQQNTDDDEWDIYTVVGVIFILAVTALVLYMMLRLFGGLFYLLGSGGPGSSSDSSSDSHIFDSDSFSSGDSFGGGDSGGGGSDDSW